MMDNKDPNTIRGFNIDVLNALQMALNFTYTLDMPEDYSYGKLLPNGTWTGLVGAVKRHDYNFSAHMMRMTAQRSEAIRFTNVIAQHRNVFISRGLESAGSNTILSMMAVNSWLFLFGLTALMSLMFYAAVLLTPERFQNSMSFISVLGLVIGQGTSPTKVISIRILFFTSLVFGLLLLNVFSAGLASHLSVTLPPKAVENVEDIESHGLSLFVMGGGGTLYTFTSAGPETTEYRIWKNQLSTNPDYYTPLKNEDQIANFLGDEKGVMLTNPNRFKSWRSENKDVGCKFMVAPRNLVVRYGWPMNKKFPYVR